MKRYFLILCILPSVLTAQILTGRTNILQESDGITLRSKSTDDLPDTTYYYLDSKYGSRLYKYYWTEYDEQGNVILEQGYMDNSFPNKVDTEFKAEYSYYQQGDTAVTEIITSKILNTNVGWQFYSKTIYYLNAKGDPIQRLSYYPLENGGWDLNSNVKFDIAYDAQNRVSEYTGLTLNQSGSWSAYIYVTVTYRISSWNSISAADAMLTSYYYPDASGQWQLDNTVESIFDSHGNVIVETTTYYDGTQYIDTYKYVYPSDIVTNNITVAEISSTVYPNPAADCATISLQGVDKAVVTLISSTGQVALIQTVKNNEKINVSRFAKGFYLLVVQTDKGRDVHKLIVK